MSTIYKIAGVQMDVTIADRAANLKRIESRWEESRRSSAHLTIFPECALTGYCFASLEEARPQAETIPGPSTQQLTQVAQRVGGYAVVGMLEADGDRVFNACVLIGPEGVIASYRKVHLPFLGIDMFVTPGNRPFAVHGAGEVRVGMHICYDGSFPEAGRVMSLLGADLLALPTNWPPGSECTADFVMNARALENNVYLIAANRVGTERGFHFIGKSKICSPSGRTLAEAQHDQEDILYADIDVAIARNKHLVRVPGKHEINRFQDRRPEFYGPIVSEN